MLLMSVRFRWCACLSVCSPFILSWLLWSRLKVQISLSEILLLRGHSGWACSKLSYPPAPSHNLCLLTSWTQGPDMSEVGLPRVPFPIQHRKLIWKHLQRKRHFRPLALVEHGYFRWNNLGKAVYWTHWSNTQFMQHKFGNHPLGGSFNSLVQIRT